MTQGTILYLQFLIDQPAVLHRYYSDVYLKNTEHKPLSNYNVVHRSAV